MNMNTVSNQTEGVKGHNSSAFRCGYCGKRDCPTLSNLLLACPQMPEPDRTRHQQWLKRTQRGYNPSDFKTLGIYKEKAAPSYDASDIDLDLGENKIMILSAKIQKRLETIGGGKFGDDESREDLSVITAMLAADISPQDVAATFLASPRGEDARERKPGHLDDYMQRTMRKATADSGNGFSVSIIEDAHRVDEADVEEKHSGWRKEFRSRNQLDNREIGFVIERLIPEEGITGLGALPGTLKTYIMMSWAKAITSGAILWGQFKTRKLPVLYLIPESGDRSFRHRMKLLRIPDSEDFLVRTMSMGKMLSLEDGRLLLAVKGRVVFLDTLIRFTEGKDEQYARDMAALGNILLLLLAAGAVAVIFAHHSRKESRNEEEMTLENCFRGSGDIGAIMSAAYGVKMLNKDTVLVQFECLKAKDFEQLLPIQLEARPHIDRTGDLKMTKEPGEAKEVAYEKRKSKNNALAKVIKEIIVKTPGMSANRIAIDIGGHRQDVYDALKVGCEKGWWVNKGTEKVTSYHSV